MENMTLYNAFRAVPPEAQKSIGAGRLKGMTDINPMWRIKMLTEQFGICGIGWKTEIVNQWLEAGANNEIVANSQINLYIKVDGVWSDPIPGIGGSRAVAKESSGLYTDDECYKKAYTDAISVACKALGIGADIYFAKDRTKYDAPAQEAPVSAPDNSHLKEINAIIEGSSLTLASVAEWIRKKFGKSIPVINLTDEQYALLKEAITAAVKVKQAAG